MNRSNHLAGSHGSRRTRFCCRERRATIIRPPQPSLAANGSDGIWRQSLGLPPKDRLHVSRGEGCCSGCEHASPPACRAVISDSWQPPGPARSGARVSLQSWLQGASGQAAESERGAIGLHLEMHRRQAGWRGTSALPPVACMSMKHTIFALRPRRASRARR